MSSEWPLKRLGDYCEKIGSGATPRGGKEAYLENGPVRLIRSQNIYNEGFSEPGLAYISHEQAAKLNNVSVHEGDVLLNITGDSVARVCQAPAQYIPARVNQHVAIIRPTSSEINPRYLHYFLASPAQQNLLLGLAAIGATRSALTKGMIEDLQILKPPILVQTSIANILGTLDDRINLLREINATLEAIAQTLFKSWFVDFDPVRAKMEGRTPEGMDEATAALFPDSFEPSELGEIPKGWSILKVGSLLSRLSAKKRLTKEQILGYGKIPVFEQGASIVLGYHNEIPTYYACSEKPIFIFGDHTCVTRISFQPFDISQNVIPLEGNDRATAWVYYAIKEKQKFEEYRRHWMELTSKEVVVATADLCMKFSGIISTLHLKLEANERQSQTLRELRDTLLPRLISGQLRLPEAEKQAIEALA